MRRMNYNPFDTPFASGEYDHSQEKFVLDKNLELGHIYYAIIYSPSLIATFGSAFFDLTKGELDFVISSCPMFNNADDTIIFGLRYNRGSNYIETFDPSHVPSTTEDFTIFVYQLI